MTTQTANDTHEAEHEHKPVGNHAILAEGFIKDLERAHWHDKTLWFVRSKRDKSAVPSRVGNPP